MTVSWTFSPTDEPQQARFGKKVARDCLGIFVDCHCMSLSQAEGFIFSFRCHCIGFASGFVMDDS